MPARHFLNFNAQPLGDDAVLEFEREETVITRLEDPGWDVGPVGERPRLAEEGVEGAGSAPMAMASWNTAGGKS